MQVADYFIGIRPMHLAYTAVECSSFSIVPYERKGFRDVAIVDAEPMMNNADEIEVANISLAFMRWLKEGGAPYEKNELKEITTLHELFSDPQKRRMYATANGTRIGERRISSFDALIDLLLLYENANSRDSPNSCLSDLETGFIELSKKYGMIMHQGASEQDNLFEHIINLSGLDKSIRYGASLARFEGELLGLYRLFLVWRCIAWQDTDANDYLRDSFNHEWLPEHDQWMVNEVARSILVRFSMSFEQGQSILCYVCNDALSIAKLQLLQLIAAGNNGLDGRVLAICTGCGCQYVKHHGNSTLCNLCKTPKAKSKAFRDKQKARKEPFAHAHQEK